MYANRYPITLRLALREIWIYASHIWREYRADARMRAARRRDARVRARTYRLPGETVDSSLWFLAILAIMAVIGVTVACAWGHVGAWLFGGAGAVKAISGACALHHGRLKSTSLEMLRHLVRHPGSTRRDLAAKFPDVGPETLRRRLLYLEEAGYVDRKPGGKLASQGGPAPDTFSVVRWPEEQTVQPPAPPEPPRPIVPPRRPDNTREWTTPYLSAAGRRAGADDHLRAPSMRGGRCHAYEPKP